MADPDFNETGEPAVSAMVADHRPCLRCAYDLFGLSTSAPCPECGTPVAKSLLGDLLKYSAPEHLERLHRGVFLVQASIILMVLGLIAMGLVAVALNVVGYAIDETLVNLAVLGLSTASEGLSLAGWWLVSDPDPRSVAKDKGEQPRRLIRVMVIVSGGAMLVTTALGLGQSLQPPAGAGAMALGFVAIGANLVAFVAWVVKFFASMLYLRWLSRRIPDERVDKRAKTMMWLGPILLTVGWLCVGLGPLVALVMFYNLLGWVRKDLKRIRGEAELLGA